MAKDSERGNPLPPLLTIVIQYIRKYRLPFKANCKQEWRFVKTPNIFVSKLSKEIFSKDSFLVILDIDCMYTNVDTDAGIDSVKRAFDRYSDSDGPDKSIIDLLELSLKGNDFEFNREMYQHVCDCTMCKFSSSNILHPCMSPIGKTLLYVHLTNLLFYISDIWIIYLLSGHNLKRNSGTSVRF